MTRFTVTRGLTAHVRTGASATITTVPVPRILVTRAPHQASALAERLRDLGAEPVLIPTIETVDPTSFQALDRALTDLNGFHWLLFTSANAVEAFAKRLVQQSANMLASTTPVISTGAGQFPRSAVWEDPCVSPPPRPKERVPKIAVIGPSTAHALEAIGLEAALIPPTAVAESLTAALLPQARQPDGSPTRFLLIRAEQAREHLPKTLRAAGAEVTIAPAYRTVIPEGAAEQLRDALDRIEAVTFTSSSIARNLFALLEAANTTLPAAIIRASIGPITSSTLTEIGFPPHIESPEATVQSLAETLVKYLNSLDQT